ncbi:hypothetical protein [Deinococcus planocerae]|uniref:hypothetical protein n=1 Tax=Deinococcus planocerae TaxID=1737569 RepID=UPI0015E1459F|nr:hypothetical protein [Deinococcus planocerae]
MARETVLAALVRALLGVITPEIRRVGFVLDGRKIQVVCIHDGSPGKSLREDMNDVEGHILGDFAPHVAVEIQLARIETPQPIAREAVWGYARKESNLS